MSIRSHPAISPGRQLKVRELEILSTVVEAGSMAKAALQLSVAQPSVSEAIGNLEARLGVRLLDRSTRGIAPTVYALALLKRGRVIFDELGQAIRDLEFLGDPARGEIRIGCSESFAAGIVPAIIEQTLAHHPALTFHVVEANTAALEFRELRDRNIDLMLGNISAPPLEDELATEILFEDSYFVVAGVQSPWADHHEISLAELVNEAWILGQPTNAVRSMVAEAFRAANLEPPRVNITTTSMHVRLHLLATGHYLTVFHGSLLRYNADRWSLKVLPVDLGKRLPVAIVSLKNRTLSPAAQEFIKHSRAFASKYASMRS